MATEELAEDLLALWRVLRNIANPTKTSEMTPEQYWLLRLLKRTGPLSISEVAKELGIAISSATIACKRLERDGLLRRERQVDDERVVRVTLTEQGLAHIDSWRQQKRAALTSMLKVLNSQEQQVLQELIERVLKAADKRTVEDIPGDDGNH